MPKTKPKDSVSFRGSIILAVTALVLFVAGEATILARTDAGRLTTARWFGAGDEARATQIVGRQLHRALEAAGVLPDSVHETVAARGTPRVHWRVGLTPGASALQVNYAITRTLETQGGAVFSGREEPSADGQRVVLVVGAGETPTHEVALARPARPEPGQRGPAGGRLALILYGFGDTPESALPWFGIPRPFAVALPAGRPTSETVFHAAREKGREIVLHLPLEPINYPQVSPGPGAVLVTMKPSHVTALTRKYLDQAGPVSAVANLMGSMATQDMTVMTAVFRTLRERSVPFLHVTPAAGAVCRSLASDVGVEYTEPDAVIDVETRGKDRRALEKRWARVLDDVRRRGHAIVMLRASDLTREWLPEALTPKRLSGVEIVPVAAVVRRPLPL
jgi:polysaccharide deacetylase 2 family uncharacterized protein YibQ